MFDLTLLMYSWTPVPSGRDGPRVFFVILFFYLFTYLFIVSVNGMGVKEVAVVFIFFSYFELILLKYHTWMDEA